uniref:Protein kinase domain-containing protein n=1 Tax=Oryza punctata TaxID=4537 RepID=A0A0E0JYF8_ORYPU
MKDVEKHLLGLSKSLRGGKGNIGHRLFRRTQDEPERGNGQGTSLVSSNSSMLRLLGISKRTATNPMNLPKLGNVRILTRGELSEVTENYSYLLGTGPCYEVYKGTLEDNTWVTVKKYCVINETTKEECSNAAIILSQIVHKNIIRLLGCCLEDNTLVLGNSDILDGGEDFSLELCLKIAAKTAEALEYLHEPATVAGFENSRRLANVEDPAVSSMGNTNYIEPNAMLYDLIKTKSNVYCFGIVLLELISENKPAYRDQKRLLIPDFIKAYNTAKRITAEEDIMVLDEIGRLALKCINVELHERPTMKEVVEHLKMLRRNYKSVIIIGPI